MRLGVCVGVEDLAEVAFGPRIEVPPDTRPFEGRRFSDRLVLDEVVDRPTQRVRLQREAIDRLRCEEDPLTGVVLGIGRGLAFRDLLDSREVVRQTELLTNGSESPYTVVCDF